MPRVIRKILLSLAALLVLAIATLTIFVTSRQHLTFDAPLPPVNASADRP